VPRLYCAVDLNDNETDGSQRNPGAETNVVTRNR
jgi:hypothetical protein